MSMIIDMIEIPWWNHHPTEPDRPVAATAPAEDGAIIDADYIVRAWMAANPGPAGDRMGDEYLWDRVPEEMERGTEAVLRGAVEAIVGDRRGNRLTEHLLRGGKLWAVAASPEWTDAHTWMEVARRLGVFAPAASLRAPGMRVVDVAELSLGDILHTPHGPEEVDDISVVHGEVLITTRRSAYRVRAHTPLLVHAPAGTVRARLLDTVEGSSLEEVAR